jgi:dolichol-phosphate mannosyltransferase
MDLMQSTYLSVVSPVYKAEAIIPELVTRIKECLTNISEEYEIILVCDGSPDSSWAAIQKECLRDYKVKGLNLSRNFGQHYAISAGLAHASGDWIIVMDCDLQDRPEEIGKLLNKAKEGYDIVYARRTERHDGFLKRFSSSAFHKVYNWISGLNTDKSIANYGIYSRQVIDEYNRIPERVRFFPSLIDYLGFKSTAVEVEHSERAEGKSSYSFRKLMRLGLDVIISNSNRPLYIAISAGLGMSLVAFLLAIYNLIARWTGIITVPGYTTTVFSIWFVGGILLFVVGVLSLYVGRIYDQVKGRQYYIVKERLNF